MSKKIILNDAGALKQLLFEIIFSIEHRSLFVAEKEILDKAFTEVEEEENVVDYLLPSKIIGNRVKFNGEEYIKLDLVSDAIKKPLAELGKE